MARVFCCVTKGAWPPCGWGHGLEVSAAGLEMLTAEPLAPGAVLALHLPDVPAGRRRQRVGRVAHCTAAGGGHWLVGLEVSPPFSPEEISGLL